MSSLGRHLIDDLGDDDLAELARRLTPHLAPPAQPEDAWLTTRQAAEHLGITVNALHKLTSAKAIVFEQDVPGGRCWFRRADLDAHRRGA